MLKIISRCHHNNESVSNLRYVLDEIIENYDRPTWWRNRLAARIVSPLQNVLFDGNSSVDVMDESWDVLIILDACRADLFEKVVNIEKFDIYEVRESAGSATKEWTKSNFNGKAQTDTVYVTGNPVVSKWVDTAFSRYEEVWRDGFEPSLGTVPAETVTERAIQIHEEEPSKRLIVHYLQPHYPFVKDPNLRFTRFEGTDEFHVSEAQSGASDVWEAVGLGLVTPEEAWRGYRRNLKYVLEAIEPLLEGVSGRIVITSDHGNVLGERVWPVPIKLYGHPNDIYHSSLRRVPWAVIETEEDQVRRENPSEGFEDKLRQLGYVQ